ADGDGERNGVETVRDDHGHVGECSLEGGRARLAEAGIGGREYGERIPYVQPDRTGGGVASARRRGDDDLHLGARGEDAGRRTAASLRTRPGAQAHIWGAM